MFTGPDPGLVLIRPARKDDRQPRYFPDWLRQRAGAITSTPENQPGPGRHGRRVPPG